MSTGPQLQLREGKATTKWGAAIANQVREVRPWREASLVILTTLLPPGKDENGKAGWKGRGSEDSMWGKGGFVQRI